MSHLAETGKLTLEDLRDLERILQERKTRRESATTEHAEPE